MGGTTGVLIEKPNLTPPSGWSGLITDVLSYTLHRQINQAGSFSLQVRATAQQASQVRTGWRVSLKEERMSQNPAVFSPEWLMRQGRVLSRAYHLDQAGQGILDIQGETWLGNFINYLVNTTQTFTHANLPTILAGLNTTIGLSTPVDYPARTVTQNLSIAFSDTTALAILLKLTEFTRTNLTETWDTNKWKFTDQDNLPPVTGVSNLGVGDVYLTQVEQGDPSLAPNQGYGPGRWGAGVIADLPTVNYDGHDIVNRVTAVGTEWDGSELTLQDAVLPSGLYAVQVALGPDGNPYWYIEDSQSQSDHGFISYHLVRSDVKNPSNDSGTRSLAKRVLLALASNELLRRRTETLSMGVTLLNGSEVWALPGDRVYVRFKGNALLPDGRVTFIDIDQYMLVQGRTDAGSLSGNRNVSLDLVAPVRSYDLPGFPVAIPTPLPRTTLPPIYPHDPIPFDPGPAGGDYNSPVPPMPADDTSYTGDDSALNLGLDSSLTDKLRDLTTGNGAYQACCADPTTSAAEIGDGGFPIGGGGWSSAQFRGPGATLDTVFTAGDTYLILLYTDDLSDPAPTGTNITVTPVVANQAVPGFPFTYGGIANVGLYVIHIDAGGATVNWGTANSEGWMKQSSVTSVGAAAGAIKFIATTTSDTVSAMAPSSPPHQTMGLVGYVSLAVSPTPTPTGDLYAANPQGPLSVVGAITWGGSGNPGGGGSSISLNVVDNGGFPEYTIAFAGAVECIP